MSEFAKSSVLTLGFVASIGMTAPEVEAGNTPQTPRAKQSEICSGHDVQRLFSSRVHAVLVEDGPKSPYAKNRLTVCTPDGEVMHGKSTSGSPHSDGGVYTPTGVFTIGKMSRLRHSYKYNNAPMPHAMHVFKGIYIHEGRTGGSYLSHGCIRLQKDFAERVFNFVEREKNAGHTVKVLVRGTGRH